MAADTPIHCIRCPDELWSAAQAQAKTEGTNITSVVKAALEQYVSRGTAGSSK